MLAETKETLETSYFMLPGEEAELATAWCNSGFALALLYSLTWRTT